MTIELTDSLRPLPIIETPRKSATPKIRLTCKGGKAWITAGLPIRRLLDVDPAKRHAVVILVSRTHIAVQRGDHPHPRNLTTGGRINVPELVDALHLKDGERFEIPVEMENGMLVGQLPDTLFTRRAFTERKTRRGAA